MECHLGLKAETLWRLHLLLDEGEAHRRHQLGALRPALRLYIFSLRTVSSVGIGDVLEGVHDLKCPVINLRLESYGDTVVLVSSASDSIFQL